MQPEIELGPLTIQTFGLMMGIGFVVAGLAASKFLREIGKPADWAYEMVFAALVGGLIAIVALLFPVYWMIVTSLTPNGQTTSHETRIPERLDRLPWSSFHTRLVIALGITWVLDGLEVTLAGPKKSRLTLGLELLHRRPTDLLTSRFAAHRHQVKGR